MPFDDEMQRALIADAQKLRDMGVEQPDPEFDDGDGWCVECGDEFHLDDCGGYNPPCRCGAHCRSCHEALAADEEIDHEAIDDDEYEDPAASHTENDGEG